MINTILIEKARLNFIEALRTIKTNKFRSFLTALGVIFGVASVITMLAIGKGAEKEILSQLELVGVNNIVIKPTLKGSNDHSDNEDEIDNSKSKRFSKGLDIEDAISIKTYIPSIKKVSTEIALDTYVINNGKQESVKLIGTNSNFFDVLNISVEKGTTFSNHHLENAAAVCIIGQTIKNKIFTGQDPLGKHIKVKNVWLEVIGVTGKKFISNKAKENLGIRDFNQDIYIPTKTFLVRYNNKIKSRNPGSKSSSKSQENYHQIDKLTVQVISPSTLKYTANILSRMLKRRHNNVVDFEVTIPIQLLKQQQKTKQIFNIVLSIIAGISLLIGGIGIMNIMLASVLERTKEIGIMRAIGATKEDVVLQFLTESVLISVGGGILGIVLGVLSAYAIKVLSGIETILSLNSIIVSFSIAVIIGLIFGILPAKSAANKRPIDALRSE